MSEYKYIIFFVVLVLGVPVGILLCQMSSWFTKTFMVVMIWATAEPDKAGINFVSREFYRAATRGFEISLVDICALILAGNLFLTWDEQDRVLLPALSIPYLLYIGLALFSWALNAENIAMPGPVVVKQYTVIPPPYEYFETGLYPLFEISKLLRGFFVYWILVNYLQDRSYFKVIFVGLAVTTFYLTGLALRDRYINGIHRVKTTLGHANSFSTYMAMMGCILFPLLLYTRSLMKSFLLSFLIACTGVCVILTISRGGLLAFGVGTACSSLLIFYRAISVKNLLTSIVGLLLVAGVIVKSSDTLLARFVGDQDASGDMEYRGKYNSKAKLMAAEKPLGVGLGNFSAWSWNGYAERVDKNLPPGTPPHNIWFVNLGELGYPGLFLFALIWLRFYTIIIPAIYKTFNDNYLHFIAVACFSTSLVLHIQSMLQLGYRQTPQYFFMIIFTAMATAIYSLKSKTVEEGFQDGTEPAQKNIEVESLENI